MPINNGVSGRPVLRRVAVPLAVFAAVVVGGVAGFVWLARVSVVEATFWLFDPASLTIHGVDERVKAFAVVVFTSLVLAGLWIGETVVSATFGGQIREEIERVQTERKLEELDGHVVICGYGIFGRTVARNLRDRGVPVVAIERDDTALQQVDDDGVLGIEADTRREEALLDAGIERADAVVAAIDESNVNIQIAINASQLAPDVRVVVRVGDAMYESLARRAGADEVVIPEVMSGEQVTQAIPTRVGRASSVVADE